MRKPIRPFNEYGQPHGLWESYRSDGNPLYKTFYVNGDEVGYEEYYSRDANIKTKHFFLK